MPTLPSHPVDMIPKAVMERISALGALHRRLRVVFPAYGLCTCLRHPISSGSQCCLCLNRLGNRPSLIAGFGQFPKFWVRPPRPRLPARVKPLTSADMVNEGVMSFRPTSSKYLVWIGDRCWFSQIPSASVRIDALPRLCRLWASMRHPDTPGRHRDHDRVFQSNSACMHGLGTFILDIILRASRVLFRSLGR